MVIRTFFWSLSVTMLVFFTNIVFALPISYPGGITLIQENNSMYNSLSAYYTVTPKYAAGLIQQYYPNENLRASFVSTSISAYRINGEDSRFSSYFNLGLGYINKDFSNNAPIGFTGASAGGGFIGASADWESRRFFVSYQGNYYVSSPLLINNYIHSARVGIAPYIAEYGESWHTWFMLEVMQETRAPQKFNISPLIRFFKDVYLIEIGYSFALGSVDSSMGSIDNYNKIYINFQIRL